MNGKVGVGQDRRQSVRVPDRVLLSYVKISEEEFAQIVKDFNRGISPIKKIGTADIEMFIGAQSALARLRKRDEDLADFLQHVDAKISQVLNEVKGVPSLYDDLVLQEVSLSGNGIGCQSVSSFEPGEILECSLILLPNYTYIHSYGRVIQCRKLEEPEEGGEYGISMEFALISEEDRERIIQHSFKLQSLALRNRRMDSN